METFPCYADEIIGGVMALSRNTQRLLKQSLLFHMQATSVQSGALQCQMCPGAASRRALTTANPSLLLQGRNVSKSNSPAVYCLGGLSVLV